MQMSSTARFGSGQFKLPFLQSIDKLQKDQQNQALKQANKPINAMTQIISLSENFINDMICGDQFILCLTSTGDVYFVDDALESVQINTQPIESIAISGSKILGMGQANNKLYEWSTAGLNKLSFNKENKMLLRQDFQIKEYQISEEFSKSVKLSNLVLLKNQIGLIFEDQNNQAQNFITNSKFDDETAYNSLQNEQQQVILAKIVQSNNNQQHYNPLCNDSSINETQDQIEKEELEDEEFKTAQNFQSDNANILSQSPDSFKNEDYTPEISIAVNNEFKSSHNHQPSFRVTDQTFQDDQINPSQFMNTRELSNIFNFNSDNMIARSSNKEYKLSVDSPSLQVNQDQLTLPNEFQVKEHENIQVQYLDSFKPISNQTDFFMTNNQQNNMNLELPPGQNFPYRPSSIKSFIQSNDKSQSHCLYNQNSSPSMKQCTDQMNPMLRNSKIELSYPSFLNNSSGTPQQNQDMQNSEEEANQSNSSDEYEEIQQEIIQDQEQIEQQEDQYEVSLDQSLTPVQISIQQQFPEEDQQNKELSEEEIYEPEEQKVEFQIKFNSNQQDSMNFSQSKLSSREASIVRTTRKVDDCIEESMEITIDNYKIKTKRTTTPRRVLNSFSQNKRMQSNSNQNMNQSDTSQRKVSDFDKSQISLQSSELSDSFNVTQNSVSQQDRRSMLLKSQHSGKFNNVQVINQQTQEGTDKRNKSNSSCQSQKNKSFVQAVLQANNQFPQNNCQINQNANQIQIMNAKQMQEEEQKATVSTDKKLFNEQIQMIDQNQDSDGIYYVFGDKSSQNQSQMLSQSQILQYQQRYSNILPKNQQLQLPPRDSIGRMTHQTEDNFEIEYTISNSCTPDSKQNQSNIIRRINFDELSAFDNNGCVIRVSDVNSQNNRLINSFTVNLNQQNKAAENKSDQSQIILQKMPNSNNPYQLNQNYIDQSQSQSFIFNQSQSPMQHQAQPFNDENLVSNIKSASTPSNQGNTTHIMMLTEEKFKNLKSEISNQQNNQLIQEFILPQTSNSQNSPRFIDFSNTISVAQQDPQNRPSNIQNLSQFIQHSKYFQVYENYRRGLIKINDLRNSQKQWAYQSIKQYSTHQTLRKEHLHNFAKLLTIIMKNQITSQKHFGLKRIKKFYKEKQLRVYIQHKQNQFAKQASQLLKVDQLILNKLQQNQLYSFKVLKDHYLQIQVKLREKRQKAFNTLSAAIFRKNKQMLEKSIRSIINWSNEKQILEMNFKMIHLVCNKLLIQQKKNIFNDIKMHSETKQKFSIYIKSINRTTLCKAFLLFKERLQSRHQSKIQINQGFELICQVQSKIILKAKFQDWKMKIARGKRVVIALEMMSHTHEQQQKYKYFKMFKQLIVQFQLRQKYLKSKKASILLMFKRVDDIRKKNQKIGFQALASFMYDQDETMLIKKSGAFTNLSFTLQQPVEMSMILNKRKTGGGVCQGPNILNKTTLREAGEYTSRNHYRTQQQPPAKSVGKYCAQNGYQKIQYQTNLYYQQVQDKSSSKKPTLNDYLSFTPGAESGKKNLNQKDTSKFFNHKRTDAGFSSAKNQNKTVAISELLMQDKQKVQNYLDYPLPLKDHQMRQGKKTSRQEQVQNMQYQQNNQLNHQQSYENLNHLNVSIQDMNKAFRDQISRIKERQQEDIDKSYMSSVNNQYGYEQNYDQSFDHQLNQLQIEITQTPDQLYDENQEIQKKKLIFENQSKNISPKINPLCTSESYQLFRGAAQQHPYGVQQYSIENKIYQQSIQSNLRLKNQVPPLQQQNTNQDYFQGQMNQITLSDKIHDHLDNQKGIPQTSTFGELRLLSQKSNDEDVQESNEDKFDSINKTHRPSTFRDECAQRQPSDPGSNFALGSNLTKKKSDQRYQMNSVLEQDYSVDMDQQEHDMFDEFDQEDKEQHIIHRVQSANNISQCYVKSSIADLSRKLDQTLQSQNLQNDVSQDFLEMQKNLMQKKTIDLGTVNQKAIPIQYAYQQYQQQQQSQIINFQDPNTTNQTKILHISPKFDESFVPSQLNRDLLNEMATNYQMLELTPDGDYQMLLHNKSVFQREESVYSNNQYADPIEMAMSPRVQQIHDVSIINHQNITTNQSQLNCYDMGVNEYQQLQELVSEESDPEDFSKPFQPQNDQVDNDYYQRVSNINEYGRDSRPYDFELSSHSKFKIISENINAKQVLTTESAQPSSVMIPNVSNYNPQGSQNNICKKLSFGYDMAKKNQQNKANKKSTLIVSGGEQTINFNLTQEDESRLQMVDYDVQNKYQHYSPHNIQDYQSDDEEEELDVGEEIPTEQSYNTKVQYTLPESRILQQELQEEKFNMTLSQQDLMQITQNRLQILSDQQDYAQTQREYQGGPNTYRNMTLNNQQDFIQTNIQKLRNMIKASPRYQNVETAQSEEMNYKIQSGNQSTRNATASIQNMFFAMNNPNSTNSFDIQNQQFQTQVSRQSNNCMADLQQQQQVFRSFANPNNQSSFNNFVDGQTNQQLIMNNKQTNIRKPKTQYLMPSTARNPSKENRNQTATSFTGGFVNILGERKQSTTSVASQQPQKQQLLPHQQQQLMHQNSQKVLRDRSITSNSNQQKKSSSGSSNVGYQPMTFRAPLAHFSSGNVQQYNSFGGVANSQIVNTNQIQNSNVNNSYHSNSQSRQTNSKNSSNISSNTSRFLNVSGSGNPHNTSGNYLTNERRISHQDISVNLSNNGSVKQQQNLSGFGNMSQRASQNSLTGKSRNNNNQQADKLQTFLTMGNKVMQQNVNELIRNSQNSSMNNTSGANNNRQGQNFSNFRNPLQTKREY